MHFFQKLCDCPEQKTAAETCPTAVHSFYILDLPANFLQVLLHLLRPIFFNAVFPLAHLLFLIIQHAVAVSLKLRVCDLITEFLAHAFVFLKFSDAARTVTALLLQTFLHAFYNFLIFIQSYFCHLNSSCSPS